MNWRVRVLYEIFLFPKLSRYHDGGERMAKDIKILLWDLNRAEGI